MRKSLFVSICWMVGCWGMALTAQAQSRVVDLNGQGVPGVVITAAGQCSVKLGGTTGTESRTSTTQTDSNGAFNWPAECGPPYGGSMGYSFAKAGYRFTNGGEFFVLNNFFIPFRFDTRIPLVFAAPTTIPAWTGVSAADYALANLTNEMIVAGFGNGIAATTAIAPLPLPTTLGARKIVVRDMNGKEAAARFLFISPTQINFVMPSGLAEGPCTIKLLDSGDDVTHVALVTLSAARPSLFTANADGKGIPAALIVRVKPGNVQSFEPLAQYDQRQQKWVPLPIDLGPETESVFLVLYGTGWRNYPATGGLPTQVTLAGVNCEVTYVGSQLVLAGLDQINARIPRSLIGRGDVNLMVSSISNELGWPLKIK